MRDEHTPTPWTIWDGCSWRRFASVPANCTVIEPTKHWRDNHPDLHMKREDGEFVILAVNSHDELLEACKATQIFCANTLEDYDLPSEVMTKLRMVYDIASAAIAKATEQA